MVDMQASEAQHRLAETKFYPPLLREDVIPRQHLLDDLRNRMASHPLTLLSAPAGYGKTTLLAALPPAYPDLSMAWLSLDEEDNDPARFLTALIVALQHLNPTCGATAQSLLTSHVHRGADVRRVASVLINDVLETLSDPFAVILDDLHLISEPSIYVALDYLLEHRPPQMHLVAASRVDPPLALARLRARGEVAELRLAELRFSDEEAMTFLNNRLHLGLSGDELDLLQSRTEGWAVGLRLLASSLNGLSSAEDRRVLIDHLAQTDRYIFDFLAEEVFNRQEPEARTFLLETAILPELTSTLCQAITGRANAGAMLEALYRRNLFLVQVSPLQGQTSSDPRVSHPYQPQLDTDNLKPETKYRYHDLFAEFLRHKLEQTRPEHLPDLHLRAAQAESDPTRAVAHYLAAARWQEAADLIEQVGAEMFNRGYLDTLSRWINALPASVRERRPHLLHYLSHCAFWKGAWLEVQSLLKRALHSFEVAGDEAGQGEVLADLAICAVAQGDLERGSALFGQALAYPIPPHTRVQALLGRALAQGAWGDWAQTERDFNAAMALVRRSGGLDPLHLVAFPFFHPGFAFLPGGLEHLERICRQAKAQVGDEVSPSRLMVEEMTTVLHLFRGRLAEAVRTGESALALRQRLGGHPYVSLDAALFLMIAHAARGDYAAVEPLFELLFLGVDQKGQPPPDLPVYLFYAGRVRWLQACAQSFDIAQDRPFDTAQGRPFDTAQDRSGRNSYLAEAGEIYAQMCAPMEEDPQLDFPEARICRTWMGSLLDMAEGRYEKAERALRQREVLEQTDRDSTMHGSTRLMLARLYLQQNRRQEALAELASALAYHEQLGIPFAILLEGQSIVPLLRLAVEQGVHEDYAAYLLELLGADDQPRAVHVPQTGETLTPREVEVLRQIVQGASNRTIAERLVIAESTVKTHIYHIFAKLEVSSRTEAAARSREMRLL
jgi:LuxR family maltose regulon positive regulatory protein